MIYFGYIQNSAEFFYSFRARGQDWILSQIQAKKMPMCLINIRTRITQRDAKLGAVASSLCPWNVPEYPAMLLAGLLAVGGWFARPAYPNKDVSAQAWVNCIVENARVGMKSKGRREAGVGEDLPGFIRDRTGRQRPRSVRAPPQKPKREKRGSARQDKDMTSSPHRPRALVVSPSPTSFGRDCSLDSERVTFYLKRDGAPFLQIQCQQPVDRWSCLCFT